eukprot:gene12605-6425_t
MTISEEVTKTLEFLLEEFKFVKTEISSIKQEQTEIKNNLKNINFEQETQKLTEKLEIQVKKLMQKGKPKLSTENGVLENIQELNLIEIEKKIDIFEKQIQSSNSKIEIFNEEIKKIISELKEKLNSNLKNPFENENIEEKKIYLKFPNKNFYTTKEILISIGKSDFFSGLLNENSVIPREYSLDGGLIINRDEKSFEIILDYLSYQTLPSPSSFENVNWKKVNSEINFYGFKIPQIKKHVATIIFASYYSKDYVQCSGITINGKNSLMEIETQNMHFWYSLFTEHGWNVDHVISNKQPPKFDNLNTTFILSKYDVADGSLDLCVDI